MDTLSRALLCATLWSPAVLAVAGTCPSSAGADAHPTFDASRLKEGRFTYQTSLKGEPLGETVIEVRRDGEKLRISMSAPEIAQSWDVTVAKTFTPLTASLRMRGRNGPYSMSLRYLGATVAGEESESGVTRPVNASLPGVFIDQRVDWAAIMTANTVAGSLALRVYDPSTGASAMVGKIAGVHTLHTAGKDIAALRLDYSICKRDHVEQYSVYATSDTPRYMIREDMPNGLVSELIRIDP